MIHETAEVDKTASIGEGTSIWHHAQVREGAVIGKNCNIGKGVYIGKDVTIGDNCKIQNYACLFQGVIIEDNVFIGPHVCFTNDLYPDALKWSPDRLIQTLVHSGVSIGANSTILCGNILGANSMIGAGSVVVKDVFGGTVVSGNPARRMGERKDYK